jgi:hypothetical protein
LTLAQHSIDGGFVSASDVEWKVWDDEETVIVGFQFKDDREGVAIVMTASEARWLAQALLHHASFPSSDEEGHVWTTSG